MQGVVILEIKQLTLEEAEKEAYLISQLVDEATTYDIAEDILSRRFFELTYHTGAMEIKQTVMLDEYDNFYGYDAINRFVTGKFIDNRYIVFYIINKDNSVTRFIGYNSQTHITIKFVDSKISTGLQIKEITDINKEMKQVYNHTAELLRECKPNDLLEYIKEINSYQKYIGNLPTIACKLGLQEEVPAIKELTK